MANATANVQLNVTGNAQQQLQKIQKSVSGLQSSFGALRNALGGVAFGAFFTNVLRSADAMDDLADSTGLALSTILGFAEAVRQSGGDTQSAVSAVQKFNLTLQEAREGSAEAQLAFNNLGIATKDLGKDQNELFLKTVKGFKDIKKETEAAALSQTIFGKTLRGTELANVSNIISRTIIEQREYVQATKDAAEANKEINKIITLVSASLLPLAQALGNTAKALNENKQAIKDFIDIAIKIGTVAAIFYGVGLAIRIVVSGLALFGTGIAGIIAAIRGIGTTISAFINQMKGLAKAGEVTSETMGGLAKRWKYLQRDLPLLANGIAVVTTALYGAYVAAKKFLGLGEDFSKPLKIEGVGAVEAPEGYDNLLDYFKKRREEQEKVKKANRELEISLRQTTLAYLDENEAILRNIDIAKEQFISNTNEIELQNALIENSERLRKQLEDLAKQREKLAEDPAKATLIPVIEEEMMKVRESAVVTAEAVQQKIKELQALRDAQADVVRQNELMKQSMESDLQLQQLRDQIELIGLFGQELEDQQLILEVSQNLERELLDLRKQELDLIAKKGQLTEEQFQKELAYIDQLRTAASSRANAELEIKRQQKEKERELENDYMKGVEKALEDIAEQYKPINIAQEAVKKGWQSIENAIDTFVETGKFKFSDFARSVIQDLAKMIAKAMIFKAISAALGAFGIKIPGLATGGPAEAGQPYIVGEKGPELFVPQNSGRVIPNNQLTGNGKGSNTVAAPITNNYNTYNISALDAKSVAQMFAENRKAIFGANKMAEREMSYAGAR